MKRRMGLALLWMTAACFGQTVCPKHIETPDYPPMAAATAVQGKFVLRVAIDAEGKVSKAEVVNDPAHRTQPILHKSAIQNVMHWTFEKPLSAPFILEIVYEYKMDNSLPLDNHQNPTTKVSLDLPDHVTILHSGFVVNPAQTRKKAKSGAR